MGYQRCAQMAFRMGARDAVFCHTSQANRSISIWPLLFLQREHVFGRALLEVNLGVFYALLYKDSYALVHDVFLVAPNTQWFLYIRAHFCVLRCLGVQD